MSEPTTYAGFAHHMSSTYFPCAREQSWGRLDRQEGRKLYMNGELTIEATGQVLTRSTATFIAIDPSRFAPVVVTR